MKFCSNGKSYLPLRKGAGGSSEELDYGVLVFGNDVAGDQEHEKKSQRQNDPDN